MFPVTTTSSSGSATWTLAGSDMFVDLLSGKQNSNKSFLLEVLHYDFGVGLLVPLQILTEVRKLLVVLVVLQKPSVEKFQ
jgi:hypothetical protein